MNAKLIIEFIPEFLGSMPNLIAPACDPSKTVAQREQHWNSLLLKPECCRRNPEFGDKMVPSAHYQTGKDGHTARSIIN